MILEIWSAAAAGVIGGLLGWRLQGGLFLRDGEEPARWVSGWAVAVAGAALGAAVPSSSWWAVVLWVVSVVAALVLSVVDAQVRRIPDRVLQVWLVGAAITLASGALLGALAWSQLVSALLVGVIALVVALGLAVATRAGMGLGDVKLIGVIGLLLGWAGWVPVLRALVVAWLLAGVLAVGFAITRRRLVDLPMGPCLAGGALVGLWVVLGGL